jgi:hypothetical protein
LPELTGIEMVSHRAGNIVKTGLLQPGIVEQTLDENHFRVVPDSLPCIQAAFRARQKPMTRPRSREAAAIEITFQREDDAMAVSFGLDGVPVLHYGKSCARAAFRKASTSIALFGYEPVK